MLTKSFAAANALLLLKEAQSLAVMPNASTSGSSTNNSPLIDANGGIRVSATSTDPGSIRVTHDVANEYDPYIYHPPYGMGYGEDRWQQIGNSLAPLVEYDYSSL